MRDEIYEILRDTEPEWMQNFRGAYSGESEGLPEPMDISWGAQVVDEYAPPSVTNEQIITDDDRAEEDAANSATESTATFLKTVFTPLGGGSVPDPADLAP